MAEIKQGNNKFYIGDNENDPQAQITYVTVNDNQIDIDHTGVPDELGGQGIGSHQRIHLDIRHVSLLPF